MTLSKLASGGSLARLLLAQSAISEQNMIVAECSK